MDQPRLTPAMASRKALVLDFVVAFIGKHHGIAPSLGEIAAGCGVSKDRAHELVTTLVKDGRLVRRTGAARGLSLPSTIDAAVRELRRHGWQVDDDIYRIVGPERRALLTFTTLPRMPGPGEPAEAAGDGNGDTVPGDDGNCSAGSRSAP